MEINQEALWYLQKIREAESAASAAKERARALAPDDVAAWDAAAADAKNYEAMLQMLGISRAEAEAMASGGKPPAKAVDVTTNSDNCPNTCAATR